ncbi:MAG: ribulokinase [Steroidobacteraceae bacterium]
MPRCVIGVDGGTEGLRAGVFDLQGTPLAFGTTAYDTTFPQPGRAEQQPRDWWHALGRSVRQALHACGVSATDVVAMAVDTTCCSVVALDARGEALRPALIWMDVRSQAEAQRVAASGDPALAINSDGRGPVSAEWMLPKAAWLAAHEPQVFDAAATICEYQDFLNLHLTGRLVASLNNLSVRWHYRAREGGVPASLLASLGLGALAGKWPQAVLAPGAPIGPLTPAAAAHLGLAPGTLVVQGGSDASVAMIGMGVVDAGAMALVTGSSHLQLGLSAQPFHGAGIWGTYADAVIPGLHLVEGGQTSTGSVVNWFRTLIGRDTGYDALNREAAAVPPGSEGVLVQEHFQGNRTPHTDALSRGAITGLTLRHQRGHVLRAIMEGVAYGSRLILDTLHRNGFVVDGLTVAGGVAKSELWLRIHADVLGMPLRLVHTTEAACLGSGILAAVGAGQFADIPQAARAMTRVARVIEPDARAHAAYREYYERYRALYPALKSVA